MDYFQYYGIDWVAMVLWGSPCRENLFHKYERIGPLHVDDEDGSEGGGDVDDAGG